MFALALFPAAAALYVALRSEIIALRNDPQVKAALAGQVAE